MSYGTRMFGTRGYGEVSYIARVTHDLIEDYQTLQTGVTNVTVNGISAGLVHQPALHECAERSGLPEVPGARVPVALPHHRQLDRQRAGHGAAPELRQLRGRGRATRRAARRQSATIPRRSTPRGHSRSATSRTSSATACGCGASTTGRWAHAAPSRSRASCGSSRASPIASPRRTSRSTTTQVAILAAAGYPDQPGPQTLFFTGARGDQNFAGYGVFDMSINYDVPVFRTLKPWVKFDVYNLFNNEKLIAWSTTVSPNKASATDSMGLPTGYTPSSTFGTATGNTVTNLNNANINAFPLSFAGGSGRRPHSPGRDRVPLLDGGKNRGGGGGPPPPCRSQRALRSSRDLPASPGPASGGRATRPGSVAAIKSRDRHRSWRNHRL